MSKRHIFILGLITFGWFIFKVASGIPASLFVDAINKRADSTVQFVNAHGTIWSGGSSELIISTPANTLTFEGFKWKLNAFSLLLGKVKLQVDTKPGELFVSLLLSGSFGNDEVTKKLTLNNITLNNVNAGLPASLLLENITLPIPLSVEGSLKLKTKSLELKNNKIVGLREGGQITWLDAAVISGKKIVLGDYIGNISMIDQETFDIKLSDSDAQLKLSGNVSFKVQPLKYNANVIVEPTASFPQDIAGYLGVIATKNSEGQYLIQKSN